MQALVLGVAGLSAIPRGEVVYLLPGPRQPVQAAGPTQILAQRLSQGLAPGQVTRVLERLRSDAGLVAAAEQGRWVVIRDQAERVARARAVLAALDGAPAGAVLELAPLRRAEARLAARKLDMHFRGLPGAAPVVLALEWSNSVLLAGDAEQLDQAQRLLSQMDEGGRAAPALRAFRLRYAKAEKVAGVLRELAASDKRLSGLRVRVDAEAGAVVVLAEPELMARVERLVEDLDQPRPRVLVEALVLDLPAQISGPSEVLAVIPAPGGGASVLASPPPGSPAGARGFAQAVVGAGVSLRGRAPEGALTALDALAAQLASDPEIRVLARPRAAVPDGGEMRLSIARPEPAGTGPARTGPEAERQRLVFTPFEDPENGRLSLRVSLEDALVPGQPQVAEARLPEGALLLLVAREPGGQGEVPGAGRDASKTSAGWTLFSPRQGAQAGTRRLGIVLTARVVRGGDSAPGASRGL
jgi:general secretion pathway protein D